MANNRENYYIKLILEAIDRSSPAFAAVEKRLSDLNDEFQKSTGFTDDQRRGQERLNDELKTSEKRYQDLDRSASAHTKTAKEEIKTNQALAQSRINLSNAEAFYAETLNDANSTEDEIQAARESRREAEARLIQDAIDLKKQEIESEFNYAQAIEETNKRIAKSNRDIADLEAKKSNMRLRQATEKEAVAAQERILKDYEAILDKTNSTITLESNAFGKRFASEAAVKTLATKQRKKIAELKAQGTLGDGVGLDYLEVSIRETISDIKQLEEKVKGLRADLRAAKSEATIRADSLIAGKGIDRQIEQAVELLSAEQEVSAFRQRSFANRREQLNQEIADIEEEAAARARAIEEEAAQRKKNDEENRKSGLAKRDELRAERREREGILKEAISQAKQSQKNGAITSESNREIRQELNYLKRAYIEAGGSVRDFNKAILENTISSKASNASEKETLQSLYERAELIDQLASKVEKLRTAQRDAELSGDTGRAQLLNAERINIDGQIRQQQSIIQSELESLDQLEIQIKTEYEPDLASLAKIEAIRAAESRDIKVEVEYDIDQSGLNTFAILAGGVQAFSEGTDRASKGIAAFDNIIRGLLVLGIALFFEQIILAVVGLTAALAALASSAIAAGAALGGALAAGALQAAPAIGVLAAFANRVGNVFNAVKQANLLQQQESYKGAQAAGQQASSLDAVVAASERVKEAQEAVTEARKEARKTLEDLILSERKQAISTKEAQLALRSAVSSGQGGVLGIQSRQVAAEEAALRLSRTRGDLRERTSAGIEGSPEVKTALKNLEDAQRGLKQAQQTSAQTGATVDATTGKLNFLLDGLSRSERRLYRGLIELQNRWRRFAQQITEPLTNSFVYAVDRINTIFRDSQLIEVGNSLGEALGASFRKVFDFLLSDETVNRILNFAGEFEKNLGPLTNIGINLARIFLDIAEAANPVLEKIIDYFDIVITKFALFTGSTSGKNQLAEFFDAGANSLLKFFDLIGAATRVIFALIGTPGSGMGLDAGNVVLDQLINGLNKLADDIANPATKVSQFFQRFFNFAKEVLPLFLPLIVSIGEALDRIFTEEGIDALRGFVEFVSNFVIPAIADFALLVAKVTKLVVDLTEAFPLLGEAIQAFIGIALAGSVLGRVNSLLAPFQSLLGYAFIGKGKSSIFKILAADAESGLPSIKRFLDAWEKSDAIIKPSRFRRGAQAAGEAADVADGGSGGPSIVPVGDAPRGTLGRIRDAAGRGARAFRGSRPVQAVAGVGRTLAASRGGAAAIGALQGLRAGPVVAAIVAITAAIVGLLAVAGRLGDVWRAFTSSVSGVFSTIKDEVNLVIRDVKEIFDSGNAGGQDFKEKLSDIGNLLADVLIPTIKILVALFGGALLTGFKIIGGVIRAFARIIVGVVDLISGFVNIVVGFFTRDGDKIKQGAQQLGEGLLRIFQGIGGLLLDILSAPFAALGSIVEKLFIEATDKVKGAFDNVLKFIFDGIDFLIDKFNKIAPGFLEVEKINYETAAEQEDRRNRNRNRRGNQNQAGIPPDQRESQDPEYQDRVARRTRQQGMSQTRLDRQRKRRENALNNDDAEKFLSSFNPETVKLSSQIKEKVADYWRSLRRAARTASAEVIGEVREMRTRSLRSLNDFVEKAKDQMKSLNTSFRNRMVSIANITRNQMLNVKLAVYDAAVYIRTTLKSVLDELGSSTKISIKVEEPKKAPTGADVAQKASGGWIGNRGERGRDTVPALLGRGEAVLNWQQQKMVEPALQQTYGFGLDGMFNRSYGYHAGGPNTAPGFARGRRPARGARDGIYTASVFSDAQGYKGDALGSKPYNWAELGVNGGVGNAFGGLPYKTRIKVSYRGRSVNLTKLDIGSGGPGLGGKVRAVDIWQTAAQKLRLPGLANVYVSFTGQTGGSGGTGGALAEIAMPKIQGGSRVMRDAVSRTVKKMVDAANDKLAEEAPAVPEGGGDVIVPRGRVSGNLNEARRMGERMGLVVSSFLRPGDLDSFHSQGRAVDLSGSPQNMARFFRWALRRYGRGLTELFYDPLGGIDNGVSIGAIGGHSDHVHIAFNKGGKLTREMIRKENEAQRRRQARGIKKFAYGGTVEGTEGQAVPIVAHAGEWVLNRRHQNRIASMAGTTRDRLKGMLGFTGGPTSFAGSGEIKRRESRVQKALDSYQLPSILPLNIEDTIKVIASVNKQIDLLNKTSLKKYRNDFKTFLDRLVDLTDPEDGLLAKLSANIQRVFDDESRKNLLASVGLTRVGNLFTTKGENRSKLTSIKPEADLAKLAEQRAELQKQLSEDLQSLRNRFVRAIIQIQRKIRDVNKKVGEGDPGRGGFDKRIDSVTKQLEAEKKKDKDSKEVKALEETLKKLKENKETYASLVGDRRQLADRINEIEDRIIEAENQAFEERKTAFEETTNNLLKASRRSSAISELKKQLAEYGASFDALTGAVGQNNNPTATIVGSFVDAAEEARKQVDILGKRLEQAKINAANDPRWQAVVDQLEEDFGNAVLNAVQKQAEVVSGAISEVERIFQRGETVRSIREQGAALAERTLGVLNGNFASRVTDARRGILSERATGVRDQIAALTRLRDEQGANLNAQQLEDLNNKIQELTKTAESLDQDIIDLNQTVRRQLVEAIQARTQRSTGLFGSAEQILANIARATGIEDPASRVRAAQATGDALQGERTDLIAQITRALGSTDEFSQQSRDLLAQLLTSFQSGDPGSFANLLFTLGPAISALESTLGETERGALNALIDSLVNNSLAVTENTANLRELNGLANQPQAFSTTSWTRFRAAIFNGLGDVLPQFDIPQMATGGYVTKGGMFELHPGEFVVNPQGSNIDQGDINITVNEANKPLDVTALASRLAFEKRTRR